MSQQSATVSARRAMVLPASAATTNYYPTGAILGVKDAAGNTNPDTATRDTTSTNSWFHDAANGDINGLSGPISMKKGAILLKLIIPTGAAGGVAIQTHNGSNLMGPFDTAAAREISFGTDDGVPVNGGFRLQATGATFPGAILIWEEVER